MEEGSITVSPSQPDGCISGKNDDCGGDESLQMRFFPDLGKCRCNSTQIRRYLNRVSGPFLDRIDIGVEVPRQDLGMMAAEKSIDEGVFHRQSRGIPPLSCAPASWRRARQEKRFADESISYNSWMTRRQIEEYCRLSGKMRYFWKKVERQQGISARGHGKILKVARTLADLDGQAEIGRTQLAEAIGFRSFEKILGSL